jgi:hypothetical protein
MLLKRVQYLFLFCCVVFAQQGMVLHSLTHLKLAGKKQVELSSPATPSSQPCEQCLAFHGVGSTLADSDTAIAVIEQIASLPFGSSEDSFPFLSAPFNTRAPPLPFSS